MTLLFWTAATRRRISQLQGVRWLCHRWVPVVDCGHPVIGK